MINSLHLKTKLLQYKHSMHFFFLSHQYEVLTPIHNSTETAICYLVNIFYNFNIWCLMALISSRHSYSSIIDVFTSLFLSFVSRTMFGLTLTVKVKNQYDVIASLHKYPEKKTFEQYSQKRFTKTLEHVFWKK